MSTRDAPGRRRTTGHDGQGRREGAPRCPICDARAVSRFVAHDRMYAIPGDYTVWRCGTCRHAFLFPQPPAEDLQAHYPADYYAYADQPAGLQVPAGAGGRLRRLNRALCRAARRPVRMLRRRLLPASTAFPGTLLTPPEPGSQVLEIGCGSGAFLDQLAARGWRTAGLDIAPEACARARAKGHAVVCGQVGDVALPAGPFALIWLANVLEHLPDPVRTLVLLGEVLVPEGRLVVITPESTSLLARLFGPWFWQVDAPRHLHLFSRDSLARATRAAGLQPVRAFTSSDGVGLLYSLGYLCNDLLFGGAPRFLLARDAGRLARVGMLFPVAAVTAWFDLLADLLGLGENGTMIARRAEGATGEAGGTTRPRRRLLPTH